MAFSRRTMLSNSMRSAVGLSLRSAITGLSVPFLMNREVRASEGNGKIMILASSAAGEGANVNGPGTYEAGEDRFQHPRVGEADGEDIFAQTVNGMTLGVGDLENSAQMMLGSQTVRMARAYTSLLPETLEHLAWFQHRTSVGIHPQYPSVLKNQGMVRGPDGRGSEEIPAALAQETEGFLATTTNIPFVMGGGNLTHEGAPIARYSPTQAKTLAASVGNAIGGTENFGKLYEYFIDRTYADVKANGTAKQKRYLDRHASSRGQAREFGEGLADLLAGITDDTVESQLRAAVAVAKLKLAPVIVTDFKFTGDNHSDSVLSEEVNYTLSMIKSIDTYWKEATTMGVLDDVVFATLTVFGRDTMRGTKGGRGHNGSMCSGLILGRGINGGVVGGIDPAFRNGGVTGINSQNGSTSNPDIAPLETLNAYYKTLMRLAGVPSDRRDVRIPDGKDVASV
ncbi:MAG: hypothetical protein AAFX94_06820 [Myxococcota bacterium]